MFSAERRTIPSSVPVLLALALAACETPLEEVEEAICMIDPTLPMQLPCSYEPVRVVGDNRFVVIAAGQDHTCALTADGRPYCWGRNVYEPLDLRTGAGMTTRPEPVPGDHRFTILAAGSDHTCALTAAGEAWCWGANYDGQLGTGQGGGALPYSLAPVQVAGGITFRALGSGRQHTCAIASDGAAYCWGRDWYGEIGRGIWSMDSQPTPFRVVGGHEFTTIDGGQRFTCGLRPAGDAWCWGHGHIGELGTPHTSICADLFMNVRCSPWPVPAATNQRFVGLASGSSHSCAIDSEGRTICWGDQGQGQLGPGVAQGLMPVELPGHSFVAIAAGGSTTCGRTAAGDDLCWGGNWNGQLGIGRRVFAEPSPTRIAGGHRFTALSVGLSHACGIADTGVAYCWGSNERGQLGAGVW